MTNNSIFNINGSEVPNHKVIEIMEGIPIKPGCFLVEPLLEIFLQPIRERTFSCKCIDRSKSLNLRGAKCLSKKLSYAGEDFRFSLGIENDYDENDKQLNAHLFFECSFIPNNEKFSRESYEKINLKEYVIEFDIMSLKYNTLSLEPSDFVINVKKNYIDNSSVDCMEYIYGYSFESDEQGNLYVVVGLNDKEVGTIDYNEFIESLKSEQYEKLILCSFKSFQVYDVKSKK